MNSNDGILDVALMDDSEELIVRDYLQSLTKRFAEDPVLEELPLSLSVIAAKDAQFESSRNQIDRLHDLQSIFGQSISPEQDNSDSDDDDDEAGLPVKRVLNEPSFERIVIIGNGGSGKTLAVSMIALLAARIALLSSEFDKPIPLIVPILDMARYGCATIQHYIDGILFWTLAC